MLCNAVSTILFAMFIARADQMTQLDGPGELEFDPNEIKQWLTETAFESCIANGHYGLFQNQGWNATFSPVEGTPAPVKLSARDDSEPVTGNRTSYLRPMRLTSPIVRIVGNSTANCTDSKQMRSDFNGTDCREAINDLFNKNLWTNPFDFESSQCIDGSTPGNTCTGTICSFYQETNGSRYDTRQLINTMISLHRNCSEKGQGAYWSDGFTDLTFHVCELPS